MDTASLISVLTTVATCGGVGACIDFWLGKSGDKRLKERLENWWLTLSYLKWSSFGREEANFALEKMDDIFGGFISVRRLIIMTVLFVIGFAVLLLPRVCGSHGDIYYPSYGELISGDFEAFRYYVLIWFTLFMSVIMFSFSISLTRNISSILASTLPNNAVASLCEFATISLLHFILLCYMGGISIFFALLVSYTIKFGVFYILPSSGNHIDWGIYTFQISSFADNLFDPSRLSLSYVLSSLLKIENYCSDERTSGLAFGHLLSGLTNLGRLSLALIFLLSFLLRPIRVPVLIVLARIVESDKPVFTILFGGVAAAAKSIQEITKLWS